MGSGMSIDLFSLPNAHKGKYPNANRDSGGQVNPMSQERLLGGGKQGRASVNRSPDSGGIHSLIGAIDTSRLIRYCSGCPKRAFLFPIPYGNLRKKDA